MFATQKSYTLKSTIKKFDLHNMMGSILVCYFFHPFPYLRVDRYSKIS